MHIARTIRIPSQRGISVLALIAFAASAPAANRPRPNVITRDSLQYLHLGPNDLPWDAVLSAFSRGQYLANAEYSTPDCQTWEGPPVSMRDAAVTVPRFTIFVRMEAPWTPERAVRFAAKEAKGYRVSHTEITGKPLVRSFSDRAWLRLGYGSSTKNAASVSSRDVTREANLIFTRANVWVSIGVSRRSEAFPVTLLTDLGARIGRRIDALKAGKSLPPIVLPVSSGELGIRHQETWQANRSATLLGKPVTTNVLQNGKMAPRSLRAVRITSRDYMVPLAGLSAVMQGGEGWYRVAVKGNRASVNIENRPVEVTKGSSQAKIGDRTVRLSRPAEFRGTQVFVPLSLMERALGRKPTWTTIGGKPAATF